MAKKYNAHKASTTANQASGTSDHANKLNPNIGEALTKLHEWLGKFGISASRKKVMKTFGTKMGGGKLSALIQLF